MPSRRQTGPRTATQRWATAGVAATSIGLIALLAVLVLTSGDRAVPGPLAALSLLLPAGLAVVATQVGVEFRRRRAKPEGRGPRAGAAP